MDGEAKLEAAGTTAYLVWVVRILLPILLFIFWYRSQAPADSDARFCYSKDTVLAARAPVAAAWPSAPSCLEGLHLVDEATSQRLLGTAPRVSGGSGGAGGKRDPRGPRQKGGGERSRAGDGGRPRPSEGAPPGDGGEPAPEAAAEAAGEQGSPSRVLSPEERARHERLLHFVAFQRRQPQQRSFLHGEGCQPPPPPPPPPPRPDSGLAPTDSLEAQKANEEAQQLLKALVNPKVGIKSAEVPKQLLQQLTEAHVVGDATTFALLVEASAHAGDLQAASDFLMKMEAAGHCAGSELLDLVMEVYADSGGAGSGTATAAAPDTPES